MLTKDQQKFWDILKTSYPLKSDRNCLNCKYSSKYSGAGCTEPEHANSGKATCFGIEKWIWEYA